MFLAPIRVYLSQTSNSAGKSRGYELAKTAGQLTALGFGLHGIDAVYGPAAYIIGALVMIVALEMQ